MSSRVGKWKKLNKYNRRGGCSGKHCQDENNNPMNLSAPEDEGTKASIEAHERSVTRLIEKIRMTQIYKKGALKRLNEGFHEVSTLKTRADELLLHFKDFEKHLLTVETGLITLQCLPEELRSVDEVSSVEKAALAGYQLCMQIWKTKRKVVRRAIRKHKRAKWENDKAVKLQNETDLLLFSLKKQLEIEMTEMGALLKTIKGRGNLDLDELASLLDDLDVDPEDLTNFVLSQDSSSESE